MARTRAPIRPTSRIAVPPADEARPVAVYYHLTVRFQTR